MRSADLGIEIGNTLIVEAPENLEGATVDGEGAGNGFKHRVNSLSFVKGFSMSSAVPGEEITLRSYNLASEKTDASINCGMIGVDADFILNYDLTLLAGTNFSSLIRDASQVILNEAAVSQLGFTAAYDAIGTKLIHQQKGRTEEFIVTGVVKNYHHRSLRTAYEPMLFRNGQGHEYYSIQLTGQGWDQIRGNIELIAGQFNASFPGNPFLYYFLDQQFENQYQAEIKFGKAFLIFSILAVIVATLGLLGLSTFMISLRTSEIGIRKVFGASRQIITLLLVKDYVKLYGVAIMLAAPIAWFAAMKWLARYAFRIEPGFVLLALPVAGLLLIIFLTIGFQSFRAASRNPIHNLKEE
jgi:putative ABC transport system permease protein